MLNTVYLVIPGGYRGLEWLTDRPAACRAGWLTLSAQVPQICWGGSIIVCANRVAATTKAIAHTRYHG